MAIVRVGTFTTTLGGAAQTLNLGFVPNYIRLVNATTLASGTGIFQAEWFNTMANGTAYTGTTAGTPVYALLATNGITPFRSTDATLWVPTRLTITGISNAAQASVTATHAFTAADVGVTTVTFSGVVGMTQINTLRGVIQSVTSTTSFTVNINSTTFSTYISGGEANIITGIPASETLGFQILNTPQHNTGFLGLTLGSSLMVTTANVWNFYAFLDADFTSA